MDGNSRPNFRPNVNRFRSNNRGDGNRWSNQKTNCLQFIEVIQRRLNEIIHDQNRSNCEFYLDSLAKLKAVLLKAKSQVVIDKCESSLSQTSQKITELERNEARGRRHSPDSTGVFVDLTSDHAINPFAPRPRYSNNHEIRPDSTVNEGPRNRFNFRDPVCYDVENEVSSSQGFSEMRDSLHRPFNNAYHSSTLYSRRRGNNARYNAARSNVTANNVNDPVQLIMQTAKGKAGRNSNETDTPDYDSRRSQSSHFNDIDSNQPARNERLLHDVLQNIHSSDYQITDDNIDAFSKNSATKEEIERYEGTLKSEFFGGAVPPPNVDSSFNVAQKNEDAPLAKEDTSQKKEDAEKLSSMLEKMMDIRNNTLHSDDNVDESSNPIVNDSSRKSSVVSIPDVSPVNDHAPAMPSESNSWKTPAERGTSDKEKKSGTLSARERILQDIKQIHKVGESGIINPSLKQLKSDVKKASSASDTQLRPDTDTQKEPSVDRGSSMSISPSDRNERRSRSPKSKHFDEMARDRKLSTDHHFSRGSRASSQSSSPASRHSDSPHRVPPYSKSSHSFSNSRGSYHPRYNKNHRDDFRNRFPSPRMHSPVPSTSSTYFRDSNRDGEEDRDFSSGSSIPPGSFKNKNGDDERPFDGGKKKRNRKRNRFRSRERSSDRSNIDRRSPPRRLDDDRSRSIDRRSPWRSDGRSPPRKPPSNVQNRYKIDNRGLNNAKNNVGVHSFESFLNNIGSGGTSNNEQKKSDDSEKKPDDEREAEDKDKPEKPENPQIPKLFKKSKNKFSVDTNLPADKKFNLNTKNSTQEKEWLPTEQQENRTAIPNTSILPPMPTPVPRPVPAPVLRPVPAPVPKPVPAPVLATVPAPVLAPVLAPILAPVHASVPMLVPAPVPPPVRRNSTISNTQDNFRPNSHVSPRPFVADDSRRNVILPKDPRAAKTNHFQNRRPTDPRVKPNDKFPRTDPRLKNNKFHSMAQPGSKSAPYRDPRMPKTRPPPPAAASSHAIYPTFTPNEDHIVNDFSNVDSGAPKSRPNFGANRENSFNRFNASSTGKAKHSPKGGKFQPNFSKNVNKKPAVETFKDAENLKERIKQKNEYFSPLEQIFTDTTTAKTGKGYGEQKSKHKIASFKIPKIQKPKEPPKEQPLPKEQRSERAMLPNDIFPPSTSHQTNFTNDDADESWDTALNDDAWDMPTNVEENRDISRMNDEPVPCKSTDRVPSPKPSEVPPAFSAEPNEPFSRTTTFCGIIDDDECWDPVDSPPAVENTNESNKKDDDVEDNNDELVFVSLTSNSRPEVIDISECNDSRPDSMDNRDKTNESAREDAYDDDVRIMSPKRHTDVIEIDSSDDLDKVETPPRIRSPERINNMSVTVYSLDDDECDENVTSSTSKLMNKPESDSNTTEKEDYRNVDVAVEVADFQKVQEKFSDINVEDDSTTSAFAESDGPLDLNNSGKKKRKRGKRGKRKNNPELLAKVNTVVEKLISGKTPVEEKNDALTAAEAKLASDEKTSSPTEKNSTSNSELIKLMLDYLKTLPDFSEVVEDEVNMDPSKLLFSLFSKLDFEAFTYLQNLISNHGAKSNQDTSTKEPPPPVQPVQPQPLATPSPPPLVVEAEEIRPMPIEAAKPKKPKRGPQKGKKIATKSTTPKMASVPQKQSTKRHTTELDRLHADIEKMKHTKNNIFTIGEKRSCRSHPPIYSERFNKDLLKTRPPVVEEKKNVDSSESENDDVRSGIRRTRSTAELDSESDTSKCSNRSKRKFKSKAIISDDSDSDSDDEVLKKPTIVKLDKKVKRRSITSNDLSRSKPCPRRVKMKRFGAKYEEFESTGIQKTPPRMQKPINDLLATVIVPKYPANCDNTTTCLCHGKVTPVTNRRKHESFGLATTDDQQPDDENPSVTPLKIRRGKRKTGTKPQPKTSKLRKMLNKQVQRGGNVSWQIVNQFKSQNVKKNDDIKSDEHPSADDAGTASVEEPKSKVSPVKGPLVYPSEPEDESKEMLESSMLDDGNEDVEEYPHYNAFKDANLTTLTIDTVGVKLKDLQMMYMCNTEWCNYETNDLKMILIHLNFLHKGVKCSNGTCKLCPDIESFPSMKAAFHHLLQEHLDVVPNEECQPIAPIVTIKDEPLDEVPPPNDENVQDCLMETEPEPLQSPELGDTRVPTPIIVSSPPPTFYFSSESVSSPQSVPQTTTMPVDDLPPVTPVRPKTSSTPRPVVDDLPPVTPARSKAAKIRVRRLSGDQLSGRESGSSRSETPSDPNVEIAQLIASQVLPTDIHNGIASIEENITNIQDPLTSRDNELNLVNDLNSLVNEATPAEVHLMHLYKCTGDKCNFSTDVEKEFIQHAHLTHKCLSRITMKRSRKVELSCLVCIYCKEKFNTPEMLAIHLEKYKNCRFQCAYCTFRAARPIFVMWHQKNAHMDKSKKILVWNLEDNKTEVLDSSIEKEQDHRTVVTPLCCVHCNSFETISLEEYRDHWYKNHSQTNTWMCHVCNNTSLKVDHHLKHLILHGYGEFQCVYCLAGAQSEEAIILHLNKEHRTLYPKAMKRVTPTDPRPSNRFQNSVEELDFDEPIENMKSYLHVVDKDKVSAVTLYKDSGDENGTESATAIYVLNNDRQYVLDPKATKKLREERKITKSPTKGSNIKDASDENVIAVESSDEDCSDKLVICEDVPAPVETQRQKKSTLLSGLSGSDLYKCGFEGCTAAFEDFNSLKEHVQTCDNARNRTSLKCPHCNRTLQQNSKFLLHIGLHGVPRYLCTLCDSKFTTAKKSEDHMKQVHKVAHSKVIPANPLKDNVHKDLYIVVANPEKGVKTNKQPYKRSPLPSTIDTKNLASTCIATTANKTKDKAADSTAKHITKVYSSEEIEKHLPMQLFSEPVTCGICGTYNSKVRINIISHLRCHSTGLVPGKDITNPVPCIDKSELMFNKMTNHAAFSAKADDKRVKCLVEKTEAYSGNKDEIIPGFVPKTLRYSCSAPGCNYLSTDANRLKIHWETLHPELTFNCPHCGVNIPAEKIPTHFRYHDGRLFKCYYCNKMHYQRQGLEKHQEEAHADLPTSVQVIRDLSYEEIEELSRNARYQFDSTYDRDIGKYVRETSRWQCNLCKSAPMASEDAVKSHCYANHHVTRRYKCCLCTFGADDKNEVNVHMKEQHESVSQLIVTVYREINENDDNSQSVPTPVSPLKRNDTPRMRIVTSKSLPNTVNGIEKETSQLPKKDNKSDNIDENISQCDSHLFISPLSNNRYLCPLCKDYSTVNRRSIFEHLCREKNYMKFVCMVCGTSFVTEEEMKLHTRTVHSVHNDESVMGKLTEDDFTEKQIEQILNYQQARFSQVSSEGTIGDSIMIDDSSDEDDRGLVKNFGGILQDVSMTHNELHKLLLTSSVPPESNSHQSKGDLSSTNEYPCGFCSKVCTSSSGLKNHMTSMHYKKKMNAMLNAANKKRKATAIPVTAQLKLPTPIPAATVVPKVTKLSPVLGTTVHSVRGVYPCPYCNEEFPSTETVAKHLCVCPMYKSSSVISPIKLTEVKVLNSERMYACSYCGQRCSSTDINNHVGSCKSRLLYSKEKLCCQVCSYEGDGPSFIKHMKAKHDPMECLNCNKILIGSEELEHHVRLSVINIKGDDDCVPVEKEVLFMCPYCPTGLRGQTYDKYVYISNHIDSKHQNPNKPQNMKVKVNNSIRELLQIEVAMMQNRMNKEQSMNLQSILPKKRRNVAVKSTSRISTTSIANIRDARTAITPKIQRLNESEASDDESQAHVPRAKFNIVSAKRP